MVVKTLVYPALLRQAEISMMVAAIVSKGTLGPQECFIHKGNAVSMLFQCLLDCVLFFGGGLGWEELHQFYPKQWSPWRWCTSNRAETPIVHWANQPWTDAVSLEKNCLELFSGGASITSKHCILWKTKSDSEILIGRMVPSGVLFRYDSKNANPPNQRRQTLMITKLSMEFTIIQASFVRVKYPLQVLGFLSPSETPMYFAAIYKGSLITPRKNYLTENPYIIYLTPTPQTFMYKSLEGKIPQNYPATFFQLA